MIQGNAKGKRNIITTVDIAPDDLVVFLSNKMCITLEYAKYDKMFRYLESKDLLDSISGKIDVLRYTLCILQENLSPESKWAEFLSDTEKGLKTEDETAA